MYPATSRTENPVGGGFLMIRRLTWSGLVILAVASLASAAVAQGVCDDHAQRWEDAFNTGDAAGLAALYTEDGTMRHSNADVDRGREAIQAWAQESIDAGLSIDLAEDSLERIAEGVMVSLGSWTLFDADGAEVRAGEYMAVDVSRDGTCLTHGHFAGTVPSEGM